MAELSITIKIEPSELADLLSLIRGDERDLRQVPEIDLEAELRRREMILEINKKRADDQILLDKIKEGSVTVSVVENERGLAVSDLSTL